MEKAKRYNVKENQARVVAKYLRVSPQKLNLVAKLIRGLKVDAALNQLTFSQKRISDDVKKLLMSAVANAEHNYKLDVDKLYISEAFVGRSIVMKRLMYKSKGKGEQMQKPFSNMTIIVEERNAPATVDAKKAKPTDAKNKTNKETEVK
jgi:large subunit ribosomal protein L22